MMHSKNLVACIKVGGKILREQSERVYLPFGSEYSIYLKNLEHRRAQIKVFIDGENASGDLVIGPNNSIDLERFIKNGNLEAGNRFKFVERTKAIENHRGVQAEDGLVRVEYQFEKLPPKIEYQKTIHIHQDEYVPYWPPYRPYWPYRPYYPYDVTWTCNTMDASSQNSGMQVTGSSFSGVHNQSGGIVKAMNCAMLRNDVGITVPGSVSNQRFVTVNGFPLESEVHVMVLHLVGATGEKPIVAPITVQKKSTCTFCGKKNKSSSKFCSQCGASVEVL